MSISECTRLIWWKASCSFLKMYLLMQWDEEYLWLRPCQCLWNKYLYKRNDWNCLDQLNAHPWFQIFGLTDNLRPPHGRHDASIVEHWLKITGQLTLFRRQLEIVAEVGIVKCKLRNYIKLQHRRTSPAAVLLITNSTNKIQLTNYALWPVPTIHVDCDTNTHSDG